MGLGGLLSLWTVCATKHAAKKTASPAVVLCAQSKFIGFVKTIKTVSAVASGNKYFSKKTGTEVWYKSFQPKIVSRARLILRLKACQCPHI